MPDPTSFSLNGKVVVQCGGSGLLGKALIKSLAAAGATLVIVTRSAASVEPSLAAERELGHPVHAEEADVTSESSMLALSDRLHATHGRVDGMVYNVVSRPMKSEAAELAYWEESMKVNATGFFLTLRIFADLMTAQPEGGSIVNISSMMGMIGGNPWNYEGTNMGTVPDYFFHKGGMINLTRHYASIYGLRKVRVNVVSPGGISNPDKSPPENFLARFNKSTMIGRMAHAEEIGGAVTFLLSDAASYITGVNLPVDGGYTAK